MMSSRGPVSCTPWAMTTHLRTTRPPSRTFLDLAVEERRGESALQRPQREHLDLFIDPGADPHYLAAAHAQPEALHELVHAPGRDATDIGLLDDRESGLLGALARRQEARK